MRNNLILLTLFCLINSCTTNSLSDSEKKQIIAELDSIFTIDQQYAGIPPDTLITALGPKKAWDVFLKERDSIGLINQGKIKDLYEKYGFLGHKEVGKDASQKFWISIQHADNDVEFQKSMLTAMKTEIEKGNANRADYAMLEDRVNVNLNCKQRFGSQVDYNDLGQAIPQNGLIDSVHIDSLRVAYDLPPLKDYYNLMTKRNFQMNKELLFQKGITEPQLYE